MTSPDFRATTAAVFGVTGALVAAAFYGPIVFVSGHVTVIGLYVFLPGVAGAIAGFLGAPFLAPGRCKSAGSAALRGAAIAVGSFLVFAPLFAIGLKLTEPGWSSFVGLSALVVIFGLLAVGWLAAAAGAVAGWAIWRRTKDSPPA